MSHRKRIKKDKNENENENEQMKRSGKQGDNKEPPVINPNKNLRSNTRAKGRSGSKKSSKASRKHEDIETQPDTNDYSFDSIIERAKNFSKRNVYDQYKKEQFGSLFFESEGEGKSESFSEDNDNDINKAIRQMTRDIIKIEKKHQFQLPTKVHMQTEKKQDESDEDKKLEYDIRELGFYYDDLDKPDEYKPRKSSKRSSRQRGDGSMDNFPDVLELERQYRERFRVEVEPIPTFTVYTNYQDWLHIVHRKEMIKKNKIDSESELKHKYKDYLSNKLEETKQYIDDLQTEITQAAKKYNEHRLINRKMNESPKMIANVLDYFDNTNRVHVKLTNNFKVIVEFVSPKKIQKLDPGTRVSIVEKNMGINDVLKEEIDSYISGMEIQSGSIDVTFADIGGLEEQIQEIREIVEYPITKPQLYSKLGIEPPKGVLLYGPPGTGKTLLAKAVAANTNATFIRLVGSELVQMYVGEGARLVRELFKLARSKAPSIIFIDEIDTIGAMRAGDGQSSEKEVHRTLLTLLAELDGFDNNKKVRFIAATNMAEVLDPALLRPGRFDRKIYLPLPDKKGREAIFKILTKNLNVEPKNAYRKLVDLTEGLTGAEINNIVMEAGMFAIRQDAEAISEKHFIEAFNKLKAKGFRSNPALPSMPYS
jgi:proteasome regulatory subunit